MTTRTKKRGRGRAAPAVEPRRTATLSLSTLEAVHMRDMFGIVLPPDGSRTVSQSLAQGTGRSIVEARLWQKVQTACRTLGVPMGEGAPDFVVAPTSMPMPELSVQQLEPSPPQEGTDTQSQPDDAFALLAQEHERDAGDGQEEDSDKQPRPRRGRQKRETA